MNLFIGGTFFYGSTAFVNPIRDSFGWAYATVAGAFSLRNLEEGLIAPLVGWLVDRYGARKLMIPGVIAMGAGYVLLSRTSNLWTFYGFFTIISLSFSFVTGAVIYTTVAQWFNKRLSLALGLVASGYGVSGVMVPILVWMVNAYQWRTTLLLVGVTMWALGIPLSLAMRHKPEQYGWLPDGGRPLEPQPGVPAPGSQAEGLTWKQAMCTQAFWLVGIASSFSWVPSNAIFVHILPYLTQVGIPESIAGTVVTIITAITIAGRLGFGWLGDRVDKRYVMALAYAFQATGVLLFARIRVAWHLIPFLAVFPIGYGGAIPVRPAMQSDYFGRKAFGTIMGFFSILSLVGSVSSPVIAGWLRDTMGDYRTAFLLLDIPLLAAVPLILLARKPRLAAPAAVVREASVAR